jgi:hypothetical protein
MRFLIVKNDVLVMLKPEPGKPIEWADIDNERATNYERAVKFETRNGAAACAQMQGANVHTIGDFDQ